MKLRWKRRKHRTGATRRGRFAERQRMAVILHRFEGCHITDRPDDLLGEAAIESLLSRAYAALRQQLSDLQALT